MSTVTEEITPDAPSGRPTRLRQDEVPAPVTRLDTILVRLDDALAAMDGLMGRWLPAVTNPLMQAGTAANFALAVAVVSGVALLVWYSPSLQFAYASLADLRGHTVGGWVRAVHRYSSDLAMLFILIHAVRALAARKFAGARWLPWVAGVGSVGLVWFIGWTGYWLTWDQPAQQVAVTSMRLLDGLPIFGEPLSRLYVADRLVPSLLFFVVFFLHMLLPLGIAVGLAVHLMRISRARLFPNAPLACALAAGLAIAAALLPAPLDEPARMAVKAPSLIVDAWYLTPLALALRLQHAGLWLALFGSMVLAGAIPWLLGRRRDPASYQAMVEPARCHACSQCVQDCPFDAIAMVPRTDGKRFPSQAFVDPARCVGCGVCAGSCDSEGIGLTWFDTRREEARIEQAVSAAVVGGAERWVALVAADIDGGMERFAGDRWRARLPGYQVQAVPTASWVRPKFVETLLARGVRGVLIVRDARGEAAARDGNQWVAARLSGERTPVFRPERAAGSTAWQVHDYNRSDPGELTFAAQGFRRGDVASAATSAIPAHAARWLAVAMLALALAAAVVGPTRMRVANPVSSEPEFVVSFKAVGERAAPTALDPVAEAAKPVHMRGRATEKPHRSPVIIRLTIDGRTQERSYAAKGISHDGPALDEWRQPVTPGDHDVRVELLTGPNSPPKRWSGRIHAESRRLTVLTFEPGAEFRVE